MLEMLSRRVAGLLLAAIAFVPASIAVTKGLPSSFFDLFSPLYHPLWWWRLVWHWMPPVRYEWNSWTDIGWSLPGVLAVCALGTGLSMFAYQKPRGPQRKWEDEP